MTSALTGQRLRYAIGGLLCAGTANTPGAVCHGVLRTPAGAGDGAAFFLFYPAIPGTARQANGYSTATLVAVHDTLRVGGTLYRRVVQVDTDRDYSEVPSQAASRRFIAPGAGMVRREVETAAGVARWDVVRARIVQ